MIVWYGGDQIVAGAFAFGTLVAFIEYMQRFFVPLRDFSTKYAVMQSAMSSAERIFELLDQPVPIASPAVPRQPDAVRGRIEFDHVWFAYVGEEWVLRDVSFSVAPGETIALVGPTGSGKTTIIKLLNRSYDVARGRVLVDGVDVRDWDLAALRRHIGVVLQDVFLFTGTVASNLTLDRPDILRETAVAAAQAVHADPFIRRLPRGYDEPVRERGNNLSVGQRQLLVVRARAGLRAERSWCSTRRRRASTRETELLIQDALAPPPRRAHVAGHRASPVHHRGCRPHPRAPRRRAARDRGRTPSCSSTRGLYYTLYQLQYAAHDHARADSQPAAVS